MEFYKNRENIDKMMSIINGESKISLRIVDWFVTNFAKKYYTVYDLPIQRINGTIDITRFKVYNDYKLKLKAYAKKKFDPFCRWERISIPYDEEKYMETTIGQLNFFKSITSAPIMQISSKTWIHETAHPNENPRSKTMKKSKTTKPAKKEKNYPFPHANASKKKTSKL
jgi:hypothetical protein